MAANALGPLGKQAFQPARVVSPVLGAVLFEHSTRTSGGASMNPHTNELYSGGNISERQFGDHLYAVGGSAAKGGGRVPEVSTPMSELNPATILAQRNRVRSTAASDRTALGSWRNDSTGEVNFDASDMYTRKRRAKQVATGRGERAIYSLREGGSIRLKKARNPQDEE